MHLIRIESTSRGGLPGSGSDSDRPATGLHVNGIDPDTGARVNTALDLHKSKQGNTTAVTRTSHFKWKMKKSCSGGTRTNDILPARQMLYYQAIY